MTRSFDDFFDVSLNRQLSKQSRSWCFETQSCPSWRHYNVFWIIVFFSTHFCLTSILFRFWWFHNSHLNSCRPKWSKTAFLPFLPLKWLKIQGIWLFWINGCRLIRADLGGPFLSGCKNKYHYQKLEFELKIICVEFRNVSTSGTNSMTNKFWWLCLLPTSTIRFASDLGYRMAKKWIGLYKEIIFMNNDI